eukprot:jgi/Picsp_1/4234/NSC_01743-R1_---NA---
MAVNKEITAEMKESDELYGAAETIRAMSMSQFSGRAELPCHLNNVSIGLGASQALAQGLDQSAGRKERSIPPQQKGKKDCTAWNREWPIYSQKSIHEMIWNVRQGFDDRDSEVCLRETGEKRDQGKECSLYETIGPGNTGPVYSIGHPERPFGDRLEEIPTKKPMNNKNAPYAIPMERHVRLQPVANTLGVAREEFFCSDDAPIMANRSKIHGYQSKPFVQKDPPLSDPTESSNEAKLGNTAGASKKLEVKRDDEWIPRVGAAWLFDVPGYARQEKVTQKRKTNSIVEEAKPHEILEILQYIHFVQSNVAKRYVGDSDGFDFGPNQAAFDVELHKIGYQEVLDLNSRISNVEFDEESIRLATNGVFKFTKATGSCIMVIALLLLAYDNHCLDIGKLPYLYVLDNCLNLEYAAGYGDHYAHHLYGSTDLHLTKILESVIPHLLSGVSGIETCIVEAKAILRGWSIREYFSEKMTQYIKEFSLNGLGPLARDPRLNRKRKMSSE